MVGFTPHHARESANDAPNTAAEAQYFATQRFWTYNNDRPNMGIGGIAPAQKLKMAA
jgi:hypothetical protein